MHPAVVRWAADKGPTADEWNIDDLIKRRVARYEGRGGGFPKASGTDKFIAHDMTMTKVRDR